VGRFAALIEPIGEGGDCPLVTLAPRLLATFAAGLAGLALGTVTACHQCEAGWDELRTLSLGTDLDLEACARANVLDDGNPDRQYEYVAVGAGGTVLAWGFDFLYGGVTELFVERFEIAEVDLHAVATREGSWWVVGDDGLIAVSADIGRSWSRVELGITADLRAIVDAGVGLVVVGDGVVLVQAADGTWTETTPPPGGWGDLRGVHWDGNRMFAVGLGGVIWSTEDPRGFWEAVDLDTDADLLAIGGLSSLDPSAGIAVVGAGGTFWALEAGRDWRAMDVDTNVDLIAHSPPHTLGADGTVFRVEADGGVTIVGTFEAARDLHVDEWDYLTILDGDGTASTVWFTDCMDLFE
jgi:hypothetical protein